MSTYVRIQCHHCPATFATYTGWLAHELLRHAK